MDNELTTKPIESINNSTTSSTPILKKKRFIGRTKTTNSASTINSTATTTARPSTLVPAIEEPNDPLLNLIISNLLPSNYNFEILKTISQIKKNKFKKIALQMPEGLLMYACSIVDIIEKFTPEGTECVIMGDVTYGACCIDDFTAVALGCDMMVHYGHSCLVPVDTTTIKTLYVFVEISVDRPHLAASIKLNFPHCIPNSTASSSSSFNRIGSNGSNSRGKGPELEIEIEPPTPSSNSSTESNVGNGVEDKKVTKLAVVGTIQFVAAVQGLKNNLEIVSTESEGEVERLMIEDAVSNSTTTTTSTDSPTSNSTTTTTSGTSGNKSKTIFEVTIPQIKPLSPGEILGCTAPKLNSDIDAIIYVGDGRFHLESIMIANPLIPAFRYDPYTKKLTRELYEHDEMRLMRGNAVRTAKLSLESNRKVLKDNQIGGEGGEGKEKVGTEAWAVILGTLGRQGNLRVLKSITRHLSPTSPSTTLSTPTSTSPPLLLLPNSTPFIPILLSELSPAKLNLFTNISTFVQTSCPRLSIDWGYSFKKPLLSTFEASVVLSNPSSSFSSTGSGSKIARGWKGMGGATVFIASGKGEDRNVQQGEGAEEEEEDQIDYPMDFYADDSLGDWTPRFGLVKKRDGNREKGRPVPKSKR